MKFEEAIDKEFEDLMIDNPKSLNHIKILNALPTSIIEHILMITQMSKIFPRLDMSLGEREIR